MAETINFTATQATNTIDFDASDSSVTSVEFSGSAVITGPQGPPGATGAPGATDHLLLTNIGTKSHAQLETDLATKADTTALTAHEADTTAVHGIVDTATLYRTGGTDVAVGDGGTGASDAATALSNLGGIPLIQKGAASGVAPLNASSKIEATYLPSYVDDVLEFTNLAGFPATGETGKIYVALDTNKTYRWAGTAYVQITSGAVDSVNGRTGVVTGLVERSGDTMTGNLIIDTDGVGPMLTLGDATGADNDVLLKFNTDRAWQFEQDGIGTATALVLRDLNGDKDFKIQNQASETAVTFRTNNTSTAAAITVTPLGGANAAGIAINQSKNGTALNIQNAGAGAPLVIKNTDGANSTYIGLYAAATNHYPYIKFYDWNNNFVAGLVAHENHPTLGDHRHFTIYSTDASNNAQGRFYVEYGRDFGDVSVTKIGTFKVLNTYFSDNAYRKNANKTDNAMEVELSTLVDDGLTYALSGNVARFKTVQTETLGTINNSVDGVLIEQFGKTGKGLVIDNRATGNSIHIKNNTVDNFTVGNTGQTSIIIASGGSTEGFRVTQNDTVNNPRAATIVNAGTGYALKIDHNGTSGDAVNIASAATGHTAFSVNGVNTSLSTVKIVNSAAQTTGSVATFQGTNASKVSDVLSVENAGTGQGIKVTNTGDGIGVDVQSAATTKSAFSADVVNTSGSPLRIKNTAAQTANELALLWQSNALATAPILNIVNEGSGNSIRVRKASADKFIVTADGNVTTGIWQASSISTAYTDAKITGISGTANQITATGTGAVTLSIPSSLQAPGDVRATTYLRVGSLAAPSSSASGDVFATRMYLGTGTGVSERVTDIRGTMTATASGAVIANNYQNTITPAINSSAEFRALTFENFTTPATGITLNIIRAGYFNQRLRHDGTTGTANGVWGQAVTVDSGSPAVVGTVGLAQAFNAVIFGRPSGTSTVAITTGIGYDTSNLFAAGADIGTAIGFRATNPGSGGTITNFIGFDVQSLTRGATNIGLRIAAPSGGATANYALQLSDAGGTPAGGITFGTDTTLYRRAADILATDDDLELTTIGKGIILKSPDGTRYRVTVANGGALTTAAIV